MLVLAGAVTWWARPWQTRGDAPAEADRGAATSASASGAHVAPHAAPTVTIPAAAPPPSGVDEAANATNTNPTAPDGVQAALSAVEDPSAAVPGVARRAREGNAGSVRPSRRPSRAAGGSTATTTTAGSNTAAGSLAGSSTTGTPVRGHAPGEGSAPPSGAADPTPSRPAAGPGPTRVWDPDSPVPP